MNVKAKRAVVITAVVLVALLALALGAWGVTSRALRSPYPRIRPLKRGI